MAFNFGQVTQYDDLNSIADPVVLVAASAINLPPSKGTFYQALRAPMLPLTNERFEVRSRTKNALTGAIAADATNSATTITLSADAAKAVAVGSVLRFDDTGNEVVWVSAISGTSATVVRSVGSVAAAAHTSGATFKVIGSAVNDTDVKNLTAKSEGTLKYTNYVQHIAESISYTESELEIARKGLTSPNVDLLRMEAMYRVAEMLSTTAIWGTAQEGSKGVQPYTTAGLLEQLTDTTNSRPVLRSPCSNAKLAKSHLDVAAEQAFYRGRPNRIVCNQKVKNLIDTFDGTIRQQAYDNRGLGYTYNSYMWNNQTLDFLVDTDMPDDRLAFVNIDMCYKSFMPGHMIRLVDEPMVSSTEFEQTIRGKVGIAIENVGYDHIDVYGFTLA